MTTIISINSSYSVQGGADRFFGEVNRLIRSHGERVITFTNNVNNSNNYNDLAYFTKKYVPNGGLIPSTNNLIRIFYCPPIIKDLKKVLEKEKPEIAHIHNIYHRMPYGIIKVLKSHNVKILWWLHDYKWICPNHLLYTQNAICKRCVDMKYFHSVKYKCQKDSITQSVLIALLGYYLKINKYSIYIDLFIAPSNHVYNTFREFGFPESKIRVLPHFCYFKNTFTALKDKKDIEQRFALYVGRLEKNKGILPMIEAFGQTNRPLKIVGKGNYMKEMQLYCQTKHYSNIMFIGHLPPNELNKYYQNALFTVLPSVWYEVFGLTILESFSYGIPVIASKIGAIPEIVEHRKSGLLCTSNDIESLKEGMKYMFDNPKEVIKMGNYARKVAFEKFAPDIYWKKLKHIHESLMK